MLSAVIPAERSQPAVHLAVQLAHQRFVRPGPLVLGTALLKSPARAADRDRHMCYRVPAVGPASGPGHFCLALHVAMQVGPSLHLRRVNSGVRRMVSEDSLRLGTESFLLIDRTRHVVTASVRDE